MKLNNTYAPTTIVDLPYPATHRSDNTKFHYSGPAIKSFSQFSKETKPESNSTIPYPFLAAFCDRKTGNRFSKRVIFDRTDYDNLLGQIEGQIKYKREKEANAKSTAVREEKETLFEQRQRLIEEL